MSADPRIEVVARVLCDVGWSGTETNEPDQDDYLWAERALAAVDAFDESIGVQRVIVGAQLVNPVSGDNDRP